MTLPIISADQRLAEPRGIKGAIFGKSGIGKTSLLWTLDPASGVLVEGDVKVQTHRVFRNLAGILEAAGSSLDRVVRATVYLADMNDFAAMNDVYGIYFSAPAPARSTIQAARLPRDARVEIDVIAEIAS